MRGIAPVAPLKHLQPFEHHQPVDCAARHAAQHRGGCGVNLHRGCQPAAARHIDSEEQLLLIGLPPTRSLTFRRLRASFGPKLAKPRRFDRAFYVATMLADWATETGKREHDIQRYTVMPFVLEALA